jgi:hypothetical protein
MTSFVQPLDAGVIRCFKAHYRRSFCLRALELDKAGETDVYKINLLEVMMMAKKAWDEVSAETIRNCWRHAFTPTYFYFYFYFIFKLTFRDVMVEFQHSSHQMLYRWVSLLQIPLHGMS